MAKKQDYLDNLLTAIKRGNRRLAFKSIDDLYAQKFVPYNTVIASMVALMISKAGALPEDATEKRTLLLECLKTFLGRREGHIDAAQLISGFKGVIAGKGNLEFVKLFVDMGVSAQKMMSFAILAGDPKIVSYLIDQGVELNGPNFPTWYNFVYGNGHEVLPLLFERGADINTRNSSGQTALHHWAQEESLDCEFARYKLRYLLDRGIDVDARSVHNETALDSASCPEIRQIILEEIAHQNACQIASETPTVSRRNQKNRL